MAWRDFTEKMGASWPLTFSKIGQGNAVDAVIEPCAGGRWHEHGDLPSVELHSTTAASPNHYVRWSTSLPGMLIGSPTGTPPPRGSGLSEDQVFEIVVCAANRAGLSR